MLSFLYKIGNYSIVSLAPTQILPEFEQVLTLQERDLGYKCWKTLYSWGMARMVLHRAQLISDSQGDWNFI